MVHLATRRRAKGRDQQPSFESMRTGHFRVVVVVLVAMVVRARFSRNFFDGVSLSQKTHGLLQGSVTPFETEV